MSDSSRLLAKTKAHEALNLIESAQVRVAEACARLSPIAGMCSEWEKVCQLHESIKACWHVVNMRAAKDDYDLDSSAKESFFGTAER